MDMMSPISPGRSSVRMEISFSDKSFIELTQLLYSINLAQDLKFLRWKSSLAQHLRLEEIQRLGYVPRQHSASQPLSQPECRSPRLPQPHIRQASQRAFVQRGERYLVLAFCAPLIHRSQPHP